MNYPIYLIGYMGAGKTTAGRMLADKLGWHFVDLDKAFEEIHSYTPAEYIREFGIEAFRRKEKYVLEDLAELPIEKVIYATGGGYPCWEDNMECLKELGTSIYLRWKPEHLAKRLMLTDQLEAREPFYAQADIIVDVPLSADNNQLVAISETDDEKIAEYLCQLIKSKTK